MNIQEILKPWTFAFMDAAQREGWDLFTTCDDAGNDLIQVQRIDDPEDLPSGVATHLPSDDVAMMMVRTGTGDHHREARRILYDHFPAEWALLEAAAAAVKPEGV